MTTPQSGRESFEALVEKWRTGKSVLVNGVGPAYREALAKCADELEAALAQQGRGVAIERAVNERGEPDLIWLQVHGEADPADYNRPPDIHADYVSWYWERLFDHDVMYVRADLAAPKQDFPARFFANGPQGCAWFDDLSLASAVVAAFDKDDDWTITDTQDAPAPEQQAVTDEDVRWCRDIAGDLREAGGSTNAMRLVALERLIDAAAPKQHDAAFARFAEIARDGTPNDFALEIGEVRKWFSKQSHGFTTPAAPKQQAVEVGEVVAEAWQEGYRQGVLDERTSEANVGIAGFNAKVEPARNNPYLAQQPAASAPVGVEGVGYEKARELLAAAYSDAGCFSVADRLLRTAYVRDAKEVAALRAIEMALTQQQATPKGEGCASCGDLADFLDEDGLCASCWCAQEPLEALAALSGKTEVECNCPGSGKIDPSLHAPNCPAREATP